jgi:hypothetical protein
VERQRGIRQVADNKEQGLPAVARQGRTKAGAQAVSPETLAWQAMQHAGFWTQGGAGQADDGEAGWA